MDRVKIERAITNSILRSPPAVQTKFKNFCKKTTILTDLDAAQLCNGVLNLSDFDDSVVSNIALFFANYYASEFAGVSVSNTGFLFGNEEKQCFLDGLSDGKADQQTKSFLSNIFTKFELAFSKDILNFSKDECRDSIVSLGYIWRNPIRMAIWRIQAYVKWAIEQNIVETSTWMSFSADDIPSSLIMRGEIIKSPVELAKILRDIHDVKDGYIMLPAMCLAWYGVSLDEMVALKKKDISFDKMTINTGQREIRIDNDQLANILVEYSNTQIIRRKNIHGHIQMVACDSDMFFKRFVIPNTKTCKQKPVEKKTISNDVFVGNNDYMEMGGEKHLSIQNTIVSGRLYRLFQAERDAIVFDLKSAIVDICEVKPNRYYAIKDYESLYLDYKKFILST